MFSDVFYGVIDDLGFFVQLPKKAGGYIRVRYDDCGDIWCCEHNCQLVQCRDGHETERQHNARRKARKAR